MTLNLTRGDIDEMSDCPLLFVGDADGAFDSAILGVSSRDGYPCLVYSTSGIIEILVAQGMTEEVAEEWYDFNIATTYLGRSTPMYVETFSVVPENG